MSNERGIVATQADVGRRVRLPLLGATGALGTLVSHASCGNCGKPCCQVRFDGEAWPKSTWQANLCWADEELI